MSDAQKILVEMSASIHCATKAIFALPAGTERDAIEKAMHEANRVLWDAFEATGGDGIDWIFGGEFHA